MEIITLYTYANPETRSRVISYDPLPPTRCQIQLYLIADDHKILRNKTTNERTRAIIIPQWANDQWIEEDI